jgi:hypothetical protein
MERAEYLPRIGTLLEISKDIILELLNNPTPVNWVRCAS